MSSDYQGRRNRDVEARGVLLASCLGLGAISTATHQAPARLVYKGRPPTLCTQTQAHMKTNKFCRQFHVPEDPPVAQEVP
jgi:hypothetical protein